VAVENELNDEPKRIGDRAPANLSAVLLVSENSQSCDID
jgi:hypothetical protein